MNDTQKLAYEKQVRNRARDLMIAKGIVSSEFRSLRSCDLELHICRITGWEKAYLPFDTVQRYVDENGLVDYQQVVARSRAREGLKKAETRDFNAMKRPPMKYSPEMQLAIARLGDYKKPICLDSNVRFNVNLEAGWRNV